jgi:hypothetical protein
MKTKDLIKLAQDPKFISGIYNYCDRWCERCTFTSRCLQYAQEQADAVDPETNDINNEAFWDKLRSVFEQTDEMLAELLKERGIDLDSIDDAEFDMQERRQHEEAESHELSRAAKRYAMMVKQWFDDQYPRIAQSLQPEEQDLPLVDFDRQEKLERIGDAFDIIRWYQLQIAVKIMRGLLSVAQEDDFEIEMENQQKDSDGSVKVALIGIDRSIAAWGRLKEELAAEGQTVVPFLVQLERLRRAAEHAFPNARNFVRPGFDEAGGPYVS